MFRNAHEMFESGIHHLQEGRLEEAESCFRQILQADEAPEGPPPASSCRGAQGQPGNFRLKGEDARRAEESLREAIRGTQDSRILLLTGKFLLTTPDPDLEFAVQCLIVATTSAPDLLSDGDEAIDAFLRTRGPTCFFLTTDNPVMECLDRWDFHRRSFEKLGPGACA